MWRYQFEKSMLVTNQDALYVRCYRENIDVLVKSLIRIGVILFSVFSPTVSASID